MSKRLHMAMARKSRCLRSVAGLCHTRDSRYWGQPCDCADCHHVDGVCVAVDIGSGCGACEGPVHGCDLTTYDEFNHN